MFVAQAASACHWSWTQWATTYGNYSRLRNRTEGLELELGLTDIQTGATTALFE